MVLTGTECNRLRRRARSSASPIHRDGGDGPPLVHADIPQSIPAATEQSERKRARKLLLQARPDQPPVAPIHAKGAAQSCRGRILFQRLTARATIEIALAQGKQCP